MCLVTLPNEQDLIGDSKKRIRKNSASPISSDISSCSDTASTSSSFSSNSSVDEQSLGGKPRRRCRNRTQAKKKQAAVRTQIAAQLSAEEEARHIAMDCEMVGVGPNGHKSALARVTLVDWNGHIVYDAYIQPQCTVTDYRTFVSGIKEEDLKHAGSFESCRAEVLELLEGKVLIGHALKNDLNALNISHPWSQTRDTGKYEPFMKMRFDDGVFWPRKLKELVSEKLHREIQMPGQAHSPIEDAVAAFDLYKSERAKWEKVMDYKISKTRQIERKQQKLVETATTA
jgi:RNA exonuclease 4